MAALLTGKLLDKALDKAFTEVGRVFEIILSSKTSGKELEERLLWLKPTFDQIIEVDVSADSDTSPEIIKQYKNFQSDLKEGLDLVERLLELRSFDFIKKYRYGKKVLNLRKKLYDFIKFHGPPDVILVGKKLGADLRKRDADLRFYFESIIGIVNAGMTNDPNSNTVMLQQIDVTQVFQTPNQVFQNLSDHGMHEATAAQQSVSCTYRVPKMSTEYVVGNSVHAVKKILLQNDVNIVGVTGMGGSGKTTLASAISNDTQVQKFFQNNIIFISVSQSPNVKGLLETMWDKIIGGRKPDFQSIEDARNQLQISLKGCRTLVVLDDVWSRSDLENLLFEAKGYKTIFTTRDESTFPIGHGTCGQYKMPMLDDEDSLKLFCFWAFCKDSIPAEEDKDLVKQVAAECKGLPLALQVIGSCLNGEPRLRWEWAKEKLSKGESISPYHIDKLVNRLQMSIDALDDESLKQCFLDLGAFPEGRKFSVDSLLDIWVYVRGMEWRDAFVVLLELAKRNLLNLASYPGNGAIEYNCASELFFSQHDVIRDLAFRLATQDSIIHRKRLFMPRKEDTIPTEWLSTQTDQKSGAQFLSIHTGAMQDQAWCQIHFPEVEALALFFAASQYRLPTFLQTMPKLKVLIIYNYSSKRAILSGLSSISSPVQIRSVLLYKLIVPPPRFENCRSWERLEKLYVCLCEGLGNITLLDRELEALNFPSIVEINIDHCTDLKQLPDKLCNLTSLQKLSVTNCHLFQNLPDGLGRLSSLRVLRLSACPALSGLPPSMPNLEQLEYLDISACGSLKCLPSKFDKLSNLKTLDMRECSGLKRLRKVHLKSLKHVIISDTEAEGEWLSLPNLNVEVVRERFGLGWLDN